MDALVILVVNAARVRQVLFGEDGVAHLMKPGGAVMVSSTISSADAQEIAAALTALNLNMLDAPVSGGAVKAAQGEMTVMASGSEAAFTRLKPVLDAVASNVYRISDTPGAGSTVKIIHQLLAGVHIAAAAEAMALAARAGIPLDVMYDVVTHAAGNSGCSKTVCSMSLTATIPRVRPSTFLSKIWGWLPTRRKRCASPYRWPLRR